MTRTGRHTALAALAGLLATVALFKAPWWAGVPPLMYPPYVPIDLRFILPAVLFAGTQLLATLGTWPSRAAAVPSLAVLTGASAHLHASAALAFAGVPWAQPGVRVDLIALFATLASVLVALRIALETGRDRTLDQAREAGIPDEEIQAANQHAESLMTTALATAGVGVTVIALALRITDQTLGGERLPVPEILALALVLALGAVLLGWRPSRPQAEP